MLDLKFLSLFFDLAKTEVTSWKKLNHGNNYLKKQEKLYFNQHGYAKKTYIFSF